MSVLINRKYREPTYTLFPGYCLNQKVHSYRTTSVLVGLTFELLTEKITGGICRCVNGSTDLCPDVIDDRSATLIESKGSQTQHAFKVSIEQLKNYYKVTNKYNVLYYLWSYNAKSITKKEGRKFKTQRDIHLKVINTIDKLYILDIDVIYKLFKVNNIDYCSVKNYPSWKQSNGKDFHVLNIGHKFLQDFKENTNKYLTKLVLNPVSYDVSTYKIPKTTIILDGEMFETKGAIDTFDVRKSVEVPF